MPKFKYIKCAESRNPSKSTEKRKTKDDATISPMLPRLILLQVGLSKYVSMSSVAESNDCILT